MSLGFVVTMLPHLMYLVMGDHYEHHPAVVYVIHAWHLYNNNCISS